MIAALFFERLFGENLGRVVLPLAIALSAAGNVMVVVIAQVRFSPVLFNVPQLLTQFPVPHEARNCSPGPPPVSRPAFLHSSIWLSARRPSNPLHTLFSCDCLSTIAAGVHLHSFCRGVPGTGGRVRGRRWSPLASFQEARSEPAIQSMDSGRAFGVVLEHFTASSAVPCTRRVPDLCCRGNKHVSVD